MACNYYTLLYSRLDSIATGVYCIGRGGHGHICKSERRRRIRVERQLYLCFTITIDWCLTECERDERKK